MDLLERPTSYDKVAGHSKAKRILMNGEPFSVILQGRAGIGKSTLASIYLRELQMQTYRVFGADLTSDTIHDVTAKARLAGPVALLVDELQYLNKKQQSLFLDVVEQGRLILIATTTESISHAIHPGIASRCKILYLNPPTTEEVIARLESVMFNNQKKVDNDVLERIASNSGGDIRKALIELETLVGAAPSFKVTKELYEEIASKKISTVTVEEYKSALQKSIRGSHIDAASVYALTLLEMGELEALCRRLLVIVSEDIGLASSNSVSIVSSCVNNALMLGMPEARYPVLHAVAWMCLQPKSNSLGVIMENYTIAFDGGHVEPPQNIRYAHARDYIYPHDYPNHWVNQKYMPDGFEAVTLYVPGKNKIEQDYDKYWEKVKA